MEFDIKPRQEMKFRGFSGYQSFQIRSKNILNTLKYLMTIIDEIK